MHPGDNYTKSGTSATSFSAGLNIPALDTSLSAETGYNSTASIRFDWTRDGQLCGHDATAPNSPGCLEAEPN